jgi:hypothetical protein
MQRTKEIIGGRHSVTKSWVEELDWPSHFQSMDPCPHTNGIRQTDEYVPVDAYKTDLPWDDDLIKLFNQGEPKYKGVLHF